MDATYTLARLSEELSGLLEECDFEGAEELLTSAMGSLPKHEPYLHFQLGRVYSRWNKLSSAVLHLSKAAELAHVSENEMLMAQVIEELSRTKKKQFTQMP